MKDILFLAFESGFAGNSGNATVEFLQDSIFGKIITNDDLSFEGLIYEQYLLGNLEFENESRFI